ncbi:MAG: RagB/SusD family nutrient uptake outer membrane protein [Flavobacteriaceae bacterium]|nr:MAG: RagB/SusD family nutrient uptake outer membrane protein [Flavobacteriaceae bacterium]
MNYKKILSALILGSAIVSSCVEDLELTNPNELSPDTFFKNEVQFQSAVNAIYAPLQSRGLFARHMFFMHDNMSQENAGNPQLEADKRQYMEFTFDPSHGAIGQYWEQCYRGINKANFVLDNVENAEGVSDTNKKTMAGEARFLRAYYYFLLASRFGGVLLYETATLEPAPRASVEQVWDLVISDLTIAANDLPAKGDNDLGRATSGAASALLGKVHLMNGNYAEAKSAFAPVMNGTYSLEANYYDNFMEETEHGSESIFEVVMSSQYGGTNWDGNATGVNEITFRSQEYGLVWFNVYPSDMLLDEYEIGDPRYQDNFYSNGDILDPNNTAVPADIPLGRRAAWKKYEQYYKQASSDTESGINFKVIRYADVLLMMAEIENELGNASVAIDYLNQVRSRPSTNMPHYGTPVMDTAGYPVGSKEDIFKSIVHERMVELPGEQVRLNDILRWGLSNDILVPAGFKTGTHELLPIPQGEIDTNPEVSVENQNPGY